MRRDAGSKLGASRINDTTMIPAVLQLKRMTLDSCEFFRRAENLLLRSGTARHAKCCGLSPYRVANNSSFSGGRHLLSFLPTLAGLDQTTRQHPDAKPGAASAHCTRRRRRFDHHPTSTLLSLTIARRCSTSSLAPLLQAKESKCIFTFPPICHGSDHGLPKQGHDLSLGRWEQRGRSCAYCFAPVRCSRIASPARLTRPGGASLKSPQLDRENVRRGVKRVRGQPRVVPQQVCGKANPLGRRRLPARQSRPIEDRPGSHAAYDKAVIMSIIPTIAGLLKRLHGQILEVAQEGRR